MATVTMPQLGESVTEGTILHWLKQPGEAVALDEPLCEIETEKVTAELPSPFAGTMGRQIAAESATISVGAPLCEIVEAGGVPTDVSAPPTAPARATPEPATTPPPEPPATAGALPESGWLGGPMAIPPAPHANGPSAEAAPTPAPPPPVAASSGPAPDRSHFYSPAVMRVAAERGIDLGAIQGTGAGGRVTRGDVEAASSGAQPAAAAPPAEAPRLVTPAPVRPQPTPGGGDYEVVTLSPTRKTIAAHLAAVAREVPQAWTMVEADLTQLVRRRDAERQHVEHLTLLPYVVQAVCAVLREVPELNSRWEGDELRRYRACHIGIAVSTDHGLLVPVIRDAEELSTEGLAHRIADLAARARERRLTVDEVEGGTFTVNNTGAFGSIASQPIVNAPQVGIVTLERAVQRPVVVDDAIAIRWMANLCLSFDHRALDGIEAGRFLAALKARLEAPA
jgi:pyruvate/2-oxoglutarate dehydrogenase complex dihydrolipoamide acyltransferase (E2) component